MNIQLVENKNTNSKKLFFTSIFPSNAVLKFSKTIDASVNSSLCLSVFKIRVCDRFRVNGGSVFSP